MEKKQILVVEDQPDYAYVLSYWLESSLEGEPFEIIKANDGMDALKKIRANPPHIIILDIILPRLDGLQLCRMIKFDKKFEKIPIIMISSIPGDEVREKAKKVKADHFFPKPVDIEKLINVIKHYF